MRLATVIWAALLAVFAFTPPVQAQACDGAPPSTLFTVPASGANFVFAYPTQDHDAGVVSYTLTLAKQSGGPVISTQVVMKSTVTVVGPVSGQATQTCYAIPVVPLTQIPKGVPLVAQLRADSATPELSSGAGPASAPFASRLGDPAIRPRP